jgi:hypothetical protein
MRPFAAVGCSILLCRRDRNGHQLLRSGRVHDQVWNISYSVIYFVERVRQCNKHFLDSFWANSLVGVANQILGINYRAQATGWMVGIVLVVFMYSIINQQANMNLRKLGVQMHVAVSGLLYTKVSTTKQLMLSKCLCHGLSQNAQWYEGGYTSMISHHLTAHPCYNGPI